MILQGFSACSRSRMPITCFRKGFTCLHTDTSHPRRKAKMTPKGTMIGNCGLMCQRWSSAELAQHTKGGPVQTSGSQKALERLKGLYLLLLLARPKLVQPWVPAWVNIEVQVFEIGPHHAPQDHLVGLQLLRDAANHVGLEFSPLDPKLTHPANKQPSLRPSKTLLRTLMHIAKQQIQT